LKKYQLMSAVMIKMNMLVLKSEVVAGVAVEQFGDIFLANMHHCKSQAMSGKW
jgi:hypothetical protein